MPKTECLEDEETVGQNAKIHWGLKLLSLAWAVHEYPPPQKAVNVPIKDRRINSIKRKIYCNQDKNWRYQSGQQSEPGEGAGLRRQQQI